MSSALHAEQIVAGVEASLKRAADAQGKYNCLTQVLEESARLQAARVVERMRAGENLPLAGEPIAVKDNIVLGPDVLPGDAGFTTCGSTMLRTYKSPFTATAAKRLVDAGAVIIAKTNLDEFAMGSGTETSCFGAARNPRDVTRTCGGSSGGSAAAVAAGVCALSLGSDTGGSIRQPAAMCGVVGAKPTYGRVSRYGLVAYASSLDQIGPFGRTVEDCARVLDVICGADAKDLTSSARGMERLVDVAAASTEMGVKGLVVGVPKQCFGAGNEPGVAAAFGAFIEKLKVADARVVDVDLPTTDVAIAAYYIVASAEASSNLARFDGVRYGHRAKLGEKATLNDLYCLSRAEGFGAEVKRRIMLGTHVLSSGYADQYYGTALKARRLVANDFARAFDESGTDRCDVLLMPSSPSVAWQIGAKSKDPLAMYLEDVYTVGVNLAGLPAMSVPIGEASGLPIGVQVIARAFDEAGMIRAGMMIQNENSRG